MSERMESDRAKTKSKPEGNEGPTRCDFCLDATKERVEVDLVHRTIIDVAAGGRSVSFLLVCDAAKKGKEGQRKKIRRVVASVSTH